MIYADTSCLLKVLRPEPLSEAVWSAVDEEETVIVSVLGEEELKLSRLMTHDEKQAQAAIEAGFEVVRPGRD